ncbi:MAG: methyltransferase domain-containing protein [Rhodospirillaceae bacterium]|nr:methyltransferase domain-containing protein [Rhodospirillaceae bacterium]
MSDSAPEMARRHNMSLNDGDHHYIVLSFLHDWLIAKALPWAQGTLLDYGSGGQPYRTLFETRVQKYIAADVQDTPGRVRDVMLQPGKPVPLPDESVDTVLSSQTLEHVPDPLFYLRECYRLLRPGGGLILTAPMQWRHHEVPYDYTRFTRYGLQHLMTQAGFAVDSITPTGGVFALMGQILLNTLSERHIRKPTLFRFINRFFLWLDRRYPDGEDTINWMCLARKI